MGELNAIPNKDRTVVRYGLTGTLTLADNARLELGLGALGEVFAALNQWERHTDLAVYVDEDHLSDLGVGGFISEAAGELSDWAQDGGDDTGPRDALSLLYRLAGGAR